MPFRAPPQQTRLTVSLVLLAYIWIRALTAAPIGPYSLSIYQGLPPDLVIALGLAGVSLLGCVREQTRITALIASQFLVAITIVPSLQTRFIHFTTDTYMHVGRFKRILDTGTSAERNLYPLLHWLAAMVAEVTGLSPRATTVAIITVFSAAVGMIAVLCVRRLALPNTVYPLAVFGAILTFLTTDIYNFASWGQLGRFFVALTVLMLFISARDSHRQREWTFALLIVLTATAFAHPLIALMILGTLVVIVAYQYLSGAVVYQAATGPIILFPPAIIVLFWLFNAPTFNRTLGSIIGSIFLPSDGEGSRLAQRTGQLSQADIAPIDIAIQFVGQYGYSVVFLGSLLVLITIRTMVVRERDPQLQPFAIATILLWALGTAMFVLPVPFGPGRFWAVAMLFGVLVAAGDLAALIDDRRLPRTPLLAGSLVVLLLVFSVAAPTLYGSEFARSPSDQMTKAEYSAAGWLFAHENPDREIRSIGTNVRNVLAYQETSDSFRRGPKPAPHFSETRNGDYDGYLLITPPAGQTYPAYYPDYPETWDYTPADYRWLEGATERVYDSGDSAVYLGSGFAQSETNRTSP